jgi:ATP-binding cassette, subfamily B, beta-glucan exporter
MTTKYSKLDQSQSKSQELLEKLNGNDENDGDDSVTLEIHSSDVSTTFTPSSTPLSLYLKIYYRVYITLGPERRLANFLALSNVVISIALLAEPVLFGRVINTIATSPTNEIGHILTKIYPLLISWTCFSLVGSGLTIMVGLKADQMAHRHKHVIIKEFYKRAIESTPLSMQGEDSGRLHKVMSDGDASLFWTWLAILRSEMPAFLNSIILVPLSIIINWQLGFILVLLSIVFTTTTFYVVTRASFLQKAVNKCYEKQSKLCCDVFANLPLIQSFDAVQQEVSKMAINSANILSNQIPVLNYWVVVVSINQCATSITVLMIIIQGTRLYSKGLITVGEIVTFISFSNIVISNMRKVVDAIVRLAEHFPRLQAFFEIYDKENAIPDSIDGFNPEHVNGHVVFNNVSFSFNDRVQAVNSISFSVNRGETVALVGPSGAGKSTTLSLLYRALDPSYGSITIDGSDIRQWKLSALRKNIGIVFQESLLLNRSIRENLEVGKPDASLLELREALMRAQAVDFVAGKQNGLDEEIGERGRNLSGGERQRLSIARAILKNAPILILDEATSSLDSGTEVLMTKALDEMTNQKTTLVIAHRLSTIRKVSIFIISVIFIINCHKCMLLGE